MKRAKRFAALALVASLVLGFTVFVYAGENLADDVATVEKKGVGEEAKVLVAEEVAYDDLKYETKLYFSDNQVLLGEYPAIKGMDELNKKIKDTLWRTFYHTYSTESRTAYQGNNYKASFTVEDTNQFAKITLLLHFSSSSIKLLDHEDSTEFFVDKAGMIEVKKEVYEKYLADREAAVATVDEQEDEAILDENDRKEFERAAIISAGMVPFADTARELGFTAGWNEKKNMATLLMDGEIVASVMPDKDVFIVPGSDGKDVEIKMSAPAAIIEGRLAVPQDFFNLIRTADTTEDTASDITEDIASDTTEDTQEEVIEE